MKNYRIVFVEKHRRPVFTAEVVANNDDEAIQKAKNAAAPSVLANMRGCIIQKRK